MNEELAEKEDIKEKKNSSDLPEEKKGELIAFLKELPILIITAVILAWLIKAYVVQPFYIPSGSMEPTLYPGDRVLVNKFIYRFQEPKPDDIVVFVPPGNTHKDFIKRIIAVEGQEVEVRGGRVYVSGKAKAEPYVISVYDSNNYGPERISLNNVFVMGDNRPNSQDSRVFGPLSEEKIVGKAFMIYWPPQRIRLLY
jgi:signal peptidase I